MSNFTLLNPVWISSLRTLSKFDTYFTTSGALHMKRALFNILKYAYSNTAYTTNQLLFSVGIFRHFYSKTKVWHPRFEQGGYSIMESVLYAQYIVTTCPRHGQILRLQRH
jgi:hypothetical protein